MMKRTHAFHNRSIGGFDTNGRNYYRTETYLLRSHENSFHRGPGVSIPLHERQKAYDADRIKDITIRLLERKIQHLERVILCPDREVKYSEEIFDLKNDKIYDRKERLVHDFYAKGEQLHVADNGDHFKQTETSLHETKAEIDRIFMSQTNIIQNQKREIGRRDLKRKNPQELLSSKEVEISKRNEHYMKKRLQEEDNQLLEEKQQKIWSDKEAEFNNHIASLETELECHERKVRELEKKLDSKEIEVNDGKKLFQNTVEKKERQLLEQGNRLHQTLTKLQEKKTDMEKAVFSLNEKNQDLQAQLDGCYLKIKTLQNILNSKNVAVDEREERQVKSIMRQKDEQISDLNHQMKQTRKELDEKETEMNGMISSLKNEVDDLKRELGCRNMKIKELEISLDCEKKEISDRKERLENKVKEKDCQLHEQREQQRQRFKTMLEQETEMNGVISSLKNKAGDLERELGRRNKKIKDLEISLACEKKEISDRKELLEDKAKEKDCQLHEQREQQQQLFKTMHEKEAEMEERIASLKKKIKHQEAEIENRNVRVKHLEDVLNSKTSEIPARDEPNRNVKQMEKRVTELTDQLDQTLTKLHETKTELDETKTRLSKAMGNMLTDNNPNIADLSDKNRPTKLSERYAELYDNQWTDAFDILDKHFHTEESIITVLLKILNDVMSFCKNMGHEQMENLRRVLAFASKHEDGNVPRDMNKLLKDCRKAMASVAIGKLYEMYMSHIRQSRDETLRAALKVSSFTKECLEVCWFMVVQDPPVEFAPVLSKGSRFNTDLFKPYTSSGTHVDYVVWPALLLHEAGPVLTKGVAQGNGKKSD